MRLTGVIGAAALAVLLLLVGCGGGGSDETTSASSGSAAAKSTGDGQEGGGATESGGAEADGKRAGQGAGGNGASGGSEGAPGGGTAGQGEGRAENQGEASAGGASKEAGGMQPGEFTETVEAICAKSSQAIDKALTAQLGNGGISNLTKQAPAIVNGAVVPALESEIDALRAVEAPPAEAQGLADVIEALAEVVGEAQGDPERFVVTPDPFAKSEQASQANGFKRCGV